MVLMAWLMLINLQFQGTLMLTLGKIRLAIFVCSFKYTNKYLVLSIFTAVLFVLYILHSNSMPIGSLFAVSDLVFIFVSEKVLDHNAKFKRTQENMHAYCQCR